MKFSNIREFWIKESSSESIRTKRHTAGNKALYFWIASEFVVLTLNRPLLENIDISILVLAFSRIIGGKRRVEEKKHF